MQALTHYRATVYLLFQVDHQETDIPDALNSILTENMRKYSRPDSCLVDWAFAGDCDAVAIPEGYEPDADQFPHPLPTPLELAAPDILAALKEMVELFDHAGLNGLMLSAGKHGWTKQDVADRLAACRSAHAAITKAEGR